MRRRSWRCTPALTAVTCVLLLSGRGVAALNSDSLDRPVTVTVAQWLDLHLRLLGMELTYPAYRVHLSVADPVEGGPTDGGDESPSLAEPALADEGRETIQFDFWISGPLARHLSDAGRTETERVLRHHAMGIRDQVEEMLSVHFPDLAADYDSASDLRGTFYVPAERLQDPARILARWERGELVRR